MSVPRLYVQGAQVLAEGHPMALRGMSLFWSQWSGRFYDRPTIAWLKNDWKVDLVRAPLGVDVELGGYLAEPEREFNKISTVVEAAVALDLYVIVDWHTHHCHPREASTFFAEVGRRYRSCPNVIFEIWNEPNPEYDWDSDIRPYHEAVLSALRVEAPDNLVILGTEFYSQGVKRAIRSPVLDVNACYALHFYAASHGAALRQDAQAAIAAGLPLFASEWGLSESSGDGAIDLEEAERWWRFLAERQVGDAGWSIFDKAESSAALLPGAPASGWIADNLSLSGRIMRARLRTARAGHR